MDYLHRWGLQRRAGLRASPPAWSFCPPASRSSLCGARSRHTPGSAAGRGRSTTPGSPPAVWPRAAPRHLQHQGLCRLRRARRPRAGPLNDLRRGTSRGTNCSTWEVTRDTTDDLKALVGHLWPLWISRLTGLRRRERRFESCRGHSSLDAPRSGGTPPHQPQAASGVGGPSRVRRARPATAESAALPSPGHPKHHPAPAPPAGGQPIDLPQPTRSPPDQRCARRAGRADGDEERELGIPQSAMRTTQTRPCVGASTIRRILKRHRIPPGPVRHTGTRLTVVAHAPTASHDTGTPRPERPGAR